jgi:hypothetical protein
MSFIKTVNTVYELEQEFKIYGRADQFSRSGLQAILDLNEDLEDELDVIGLCCIYTEYDSEEEFLKEYGIEELEEFEGRYMLLDTGGVLAENV